MQHQLREEQGTLIVSLTGEVDLDHSPTARQVLLDCVAQKKKVLVDLAAVTYIDSSGVASLVEAFQRAKKNGTGFALMLLSPATLRVIKLARLDKVFTIYDSLSDAFNAAT